MEVFSYSDENELYEPTWLTQPRGFLDVRNRQTEHLESMISDVPRPIVKDWSRHSDVWVLEIDEVKVQVSGQYREGELEVSASGSMPRKYLDPLRAELRSLVSSVEESVPAISAFDFTVLLFQAIDAAYAWTLTWKPTFADEHPDSLGWEASGTCGYESFLLNDHGLDLSTVKDVALHVLQKPIADICADLPSYLRVLHVEPVFRNNLVSRFLARAKRIEHQLRALPFSALRTAVPPTAIPHNSRESTRDGLASYLANPSVTFHGAPRNVIDSIVRHGFLKPGSVIPNRKGDATTIDVRCGSTFGRGIYSSPDPVYASYYMTYSGNTYTGDSSITPSSIPGFRLIVCAALLGRPRVVTRSEAWGVTSVLGGSDGFHSHVSGDKLQCIVFDNAQIIPVYVLHLDYGAEAARKAFAELPADPREFLRAKQKAEKKAREKEVDEEEANMPGYIKAQKEAKKAAALKWFPYGFGSASGTRFVIEEIGEVDDDEEVYGEWQAERGDRGYEDEERERRLANGGSWFDEYQTVRKLKK